MKRKFSILIKSLVLCLVLQIITSYIPTNALVEMPRNNTIYNAFDEATSSSDFDIILLGETTNKLPNSIKYKKVDNIYDVETKAKYKSLWIAESMHAEMLSPQRIKWINKKLDKGYTICFLGIEDINILRNSFTNIKSRDEEIDYNGQNQIAAFISKNKNDEYYFGHIMSETNYNTADNLKKIVAGAWNRRNDLNYSKKMSEEKFSDIFNKQVLADGGSSFSIGSSWRCVFGWDWYNWDVTGANHSGTSMKFGSYVEWKAGFYLTDPIDGKDYYALAIESCISPSKKSGYDEWATNTLDIESHADGAGQSNVIRSYQPKRDSQSQGTISYSIGANFSQSGNSGIIGVSYSATLEELEVIDNSDIGDWLSNIQFNYKRTWNGAFTDYAKGTTWQNSAVIYQAEPGSSYCIMNNRRTASLLMDSPGAMWNPEATLYKGFNTYLYK